VDTRTGVTEEATAAPGKKEEATTASNIMTSQGHFVRWPHGQEGADDEGARGANGNGEYQGKPA
jgi:hypothetical protein